MAHPHVSHRQNKVERSRVNHIMRGYASGGTVEHEHEDEVADKKLVKRMVKKVALRADGGAVKARMDRPGRKRGGRTNKSKGTTVNVITGQSPVAGLGAAMPPAPMAAPSIAPAPPPMPMRPPMMAGPPPGAPGLPPSPMMPHASGGRTYKKGGRVGVNTGSKVYEEGVRNGTQVSHDPGKNDLKDMNRPRVVTYATGGKVQKRATGGPIYASEKGQMGPKFDGGSGGGIGRLEKAKRAKRS